MSHIGISIHFAYIHISVILTLTPLSGAYLRYLPFREEFDAEKFSKRKKWYFLWTLICLAINLFLFSDGVTYRAYKISLATCWWGYIAISLGLIGKKLQHVFVVGMQGLWSFMLHSLSGIIIAIIYGTMTEELLPLEVSLYLILFLLLIKVEREFFINILPTGEFFAEKWLTALIPIAIFIGTTIPIVNVTFMPTWQERFSRLFLPIFFLIFYRSTIIIRQEIEKNNQLEQKNQIMSAQAASLREQNELMSKSQREVELIRQDLLKNYTELEALIKSDKILAAREFISRQGARLDSTRVKMYSHSALLNAAVSIYSSRAEKLGVKMECKIDLAGKILIDESDLAVLVSNLLENALKASATQKKPLKREISLILRNNGGQNVLEVMNYYAGEIKIGENGLPYTNEVGHGFGMNSLEIFAEKYDAFYDFAQENGIVRVSLYWNNHL